MDYNLSLTGEFMPIVVILYIYIVKFMIRVIINSIVGTREVVTEVLTSLKL